MAEKVEKGQKTKRGTTFDETKGNAGIRNLIPGLGFANGVGEGIASLMNSATGALTMFGPSNTVTNKYSKNGWVLPRHDMASLTDKEVEDILDWVQDNPDKVGTTDYENYIKKTAGDSFNIDNKIAYIDYVIDQNANKLGFDSRGASSKEYYKQNKDGTYSEKTTEELEAENKNTTDGSGLDYYQKLIDQNLVTDPYGTRANNYRQDMYGSINAYEQASNATLASSELDAYRMLGQQQLQLESEIANQRMTALKSGTTSAQLASQQLANMFAAQSAAQQTAAAVMQQRGTMADQYNQQRAAVTGDIYNMTNNNALTAANAYAQLGAAQASYNSYINQPYAQYMAAMNAFNKDPNAFKGVSRIYKEE